MNRARERSVTPLHLAANSGDVSVVKILVEHNARINALDADQATPLHRAAMLDNYEAISYLVRRSVGQSGTQTLDVLHYSNISPSSLGDCGLNRVLCTFNLCQLVYEFRL